MNLEQFKKVNIYNNYSWIQYDYNNKATNIVRKGSVSANIIADSARTIDD